MSTAATDLPIRMDPDAATLKVARITGLSQDRMNADVDAISVAYHRDQTAVQVQYKAPADACATDHIALTHLIHGCVVDDVDIESGHRVLLQNQTEMALPTRPLECYPRRQNDKRENGLYAIQTNGLPAVRTFDMPAGANAFGVMVYVLPNPKPLNASRNDKRFFVCVVRALVADPVARVGENELRWEWSTPLNGHSNKRGGPMVRVWI